MFSTPCMPCHTRLAGFVCHAAMLCIISAAAAAADYPLRPVRIIIGFPPGGATDLVSRLMVPKYVEIFKQQFIVDNRSGANGVIGSDLAAKAAPDGHTIHLATIGTLVISPAITRVPYDPIKDFAPISQAVALQNIFIVHPTLPAKSLKEMIALAKAKPGALNFATSGQGSPGHLAGELFKSMAKVNIVHVPFRSAAEGGVAVVAGDIFMGFPSIPSLLPFLPAGRLRPLALTSAKRASVMPSVPTLDESGLVRFDRSGWYGVLAPAGLPKDITSRLNAAIAKVVNTREMKESFAKLSLETQTTTPEQFAALIQRDVAENAKLIKLIGATGK